MNRWEKAATTLSRIERMPNWICQGLALLVLFVVGGLFLNGGALLAASFMHVLIGKVDMPPSIVYQTGKQGPGTAGQKAGGYVIVPRPTLSQSTDQILVDLHSPADSYIQSDAVDTGVMLGQSLHQALASVYDHATRTNPSQVVIPPGVPLTQGQ